MGVDKLPLLTASPCQPPRKRGGRGRLRRQARQTANCLSADSVYQRIIRNTILLILFAVKKPRSNNSQAVSSASHFLLDKMLHFGYDRFVKHKDGEVPYRETLQRVRVWWKRMVRVRMVAPEWIARMAVGRYGCARYSVLRAGVTRNSGGTADFFALSICSGRLLFGGIENAARIAKGV